MAKTALHQAIDLIGIKIQAIEGLGGFLEFTAPMQKAFETLKSEITDMIPTERQQIEDAYEEGAEDMAKGEFGSIPTYTSAADYYEKTFNNQ